MMLVVISPAKRLNWADVPQVAAIHPASEPAFQKDALRLVRIARTLSVSDLQSLMNISEDLASLNHARFRGFSANPQPEQIRQALFAFAGDTYAGLEAKTLAPAAIPYTQQRLRILSGLYGLLRPLDGIQPYRLEMGCAFANPKGANLYDYWGNRIARALNELADEQGASTLVNCASVEYFGAVQIRTLKLRIITPIFLESRGGPPRIVSFFAKKARGAMARFVMENQISNPDDLAAFSYGGYRFAPELTEGNRRVFLRDIQGSAEGP